jgi:hypothetical protein
MPRTKNGPLGILLYPQLWSEMAKMKRDLHIKSEAFDICNKLSA